MRACVHACVCVCLHAGVGVCVRAGVCVCVCELRDVQHPPELHSGLLLLSVKDRLSSTLKEHNESIFTLYSLLQA